MDKTLFQWIQSALASGHYVVSKHAELERLAEDVDIEEIEECIRMGLLLEDYPDDPRGHSCLIAGPVGNRWVHVVCGRRQGWAIIITVYLPKVPHWQTPIERGDE